MKLTLTRAQRSQLFAGQLPRIAGEGRCPVEPGYEYRLSPDFTLRVVKVVPTRGGWVLRYELTDRRDRIEHLRRLPAVVNDDYRPPTAEDISRAADESAYTTGPDLMDAGPRVDRKTLDRYAREAETHVGQQHTLAQLRRERHELDQRLARALADARMRGVDVSSALRVIERQLARIEQRVYHGKAA